MGSFVLIGICMLGGFLLSYRGILDKNAAKGINTFIIYLALPAVSFKYLPTIEWKPESVILIAGPILVWVGAFIVLAITGRIFHLRLSPKTRSGMLLVMGLANTSFVGFPLITAYFGADKISYAVICDQTTFLLLSTVGIFTVLRSTADGGFDILVLLKKVILFPPFLGTVGALIIPKLMDITPLDSIFSSLAGTVGPLALFSIGLQLRPELFFRLSKKLFLAVGYKLVFAPLIALAFVGATIGIGVWPGKIAVFEAAMPTLLSSSIIAEEYGLDTDFVNAAITISILVGLLTTVIWYFAALA